LCGPAEVAVLSPTAYSSDSPLRVEPLCGIQVTLSPQIRPATEQDAADVVGYRARLRAERLPVLLRYDNLSPVEDEARFLRKFKANPTWVFFIAKLDDVVIGHLDLLAGNHPQTRHLAKLGMAVLGPYRGKGVGTLLLDEALAWAENVGLRGIELEVMSNNPKAIRLYERLGFSEAGRRRDAVLIENGYVDLVQMAMRLK
jgi:RimJ/RimL family protein N-acetyltransferase